MLAARGIIKAELWFHVYRVERCMRSVTSENDSFWTARKAHNNHAKNKQTKRNNDVQISRHLRLVENIHVSKTLLYFKTLRGGIQMQVADWDKPKTYMKKCVRLVTINESVQCYYKEDIHLADGCSSRASYSCFTLIISTCRVMDWKCSHTGSASLPGCSISTPLLSASHKRSHAHKKQTSRANTVRQHDRHTSPRHTLRYTLAFSLIQVYSQRAPPPPAWIK